MVFSYNNYFTIVLVSCLIGIGISNIHEDVFLSLYCIAFLSVVGGYIIFYMRQFLYCLLFFVFGASIGILFTFYSQFQIQENRQIIDRYKGEYIQYSGEVQGVYKKQDFHDEYIVKLGQIGLTQIDRKILHILRIPKNFHLQVGQEILYSGKVYLFEDFNGFSYEKYMLSQGIYFSTSTQIVDTLGHKITWRYRLFSYRERLLSRIFQIFPEQEAIFLGGILLGARENLPSELKEDFNNSGLTHFIAVSGFNITLCVIFVTFLFGFLPMWGRIVMVCFSIALFSLFVGLGAPVIRASIMGILGYIFLQSGASAKNITLLAFTAVCMTAFSPLSLTYDVSLHLSFLAVIGIIYTQDFFKKVFFFVPEFFAIREAVVLTLSALTFALPIMIFQFGQVSLLAPFANIAVTWTIPLAMLLGSLTLFIDIISHTAAEVVGFIAWIFLHYDMLMVRFFGNREWALLEFDFTSYKNYFQALYFVFLIYIVSLYQIKKKQPF